MDAKKIQDSRTLGTLLALGLSLLWLLLLARVASADVPGGDFDNQPAGQYSGAGWVLEGPADKLQVVPANDADPAVPLPPGASGNLLCIDARQEPSRIVLQFAYDCGGGTGSCVLRMPWSGTAWSTSGGAAFYTDDYDSSYDNPQHLWEPLVGTGPSSTFGTFTQRENGCGQHIVDIHVRPGTLVYLDDPSTDCEGPVETEASSWGMVKEQLRTTR